MMTLGPILPLVLLATPVLVALCVVLVGVVSALAPRREVVPLPRAVARVAPQPIASPPPRVQRAKTLRPGLFDDDDVTHIFDRRAHAH